ncbi:putative OPA3-like protein CG43998 [Drosophila guanche]|uniref:Blast:Putative OPA3-like protein CG13603 n=1 Tax=Drosophila guanche TaxID=7266 RepID=A0A3B0KR70_DROGU|nr:putative OPA3-like protein CG43998 [Drosophila guanche]SPP87731.1 blast:Putative OPA3-like protein CG13603 [Drosophila guanche]
MAIGTFPIGKVFIFTMKQLSRPVSNLLKSYAKHHPIFRRIVCIPPGQLYNNLEVRLKLHFLKLKQPKRVPRLTTAMATKVGADLLGEVIVTIIGVYLLYYEFSRQRLKDEKKHIRHREQRMLLVEKIGSLDTNIERNEKEIRIMKAALDGYDY